MALGLFLEEKVTNRPQGTFFGGIGMNVRKALAAASLVFGLVVSQNVFAAAFSNGSFEEPDVANGTPGDSGDIGGIPSWTFNEASGDDIRVFDGDFFGSGIVAQDADQYLGFGSFGGSVGGVISQAFDTVVGKSYQISFWANNAAFDSSTHQLIVAVDNTGGDGITATPTVSNEWQQFGFNFTASSSTTTVSFESALTSGDGASSDILLDNVTVIPEPASIALLGVGGLVLLRRRTA